MPPPVTWESLDAELEALSKRVYEPLDKAVDQIRTLINTRMYNPETVRLLIEMIDGMNNEFGAMARKTKDAEGKKRALRQVVQHAEADFVQPGMTVEQLTQAKTIFNFTVEAVKKEAEEPIPATKIPVVLLVMNRQEAEELDGEKITVELPKDYLKAFEKLKELLEPGWVGRYGETPEHWKPFDKPDKNIKDLMEGMFEEVRQRLTAQRLTSQREIRPDFVDIRTLNADRDRLKELRRDGCFVVNDVISMWHPTIQRAYRTSLLEAFPSSIVYRIAPVSKVLEFPQPLVAFLEHLEDLEFFKRKAERDLKCRNFLNSEDFSDFVVNYAPGLIPPDNKETSVMTQHIVGGGR